MSLDFSINIFNNNKFICALGAKHFDYDNIKWCQVGLLISEIKKGKVTKEELVNNIEDWSSYFFLINSDHPYADYSSWSIDIAKSILVFNTPFLHDVNDIKEKIVNEGYYEIDDLKLTLNNNDLYCTWDEDSWKVAELDLDTNLFLKKCVTFDEYNAINELFDKCSDIDDPIYLLDGKYIMQTNNG